jgi:hypothetical protein
MSPGALPSFYIERVCNKSIGPDKVYTLFQNLSCIYRVYFSFLEHTAKEEPKVIIC